MKNNLLSKKFWKDQSTAMTKVDLIARKYDDIINLSLGDPDISTPEIVIKKAFKDACKGHTKYTDFRGDPELRDAVIRFYENEYQMIVQQDEVFIAASATLGMFLSLTAILDPGDEVIIQAPYFSIYPGQIRLAGGIPIELPTYEEEDFQINIKRLENLITERTKALIINSPSNPTGNVLSIETMKQIATLANRYDIIVISDEIYTSYCFQRKFVPFASIENMSQRTITINSFSKNYMMTGWRVGNVIAPSFIIDGIVQANDNVLFTAPSISQRAALHALEDRREIQPPIIEEYEKRLFYAAKRVNEIPRMHVIYPPKGSFYLFVNIKETGRTSEEVINILLDEAHVLALPGNAFGACGEGYIRIACTVDIPKLKEAFKRIENIDIFKNN